MKRQVFSILAFEIAMISLASIAIAQAISPVRRVVEITNHRCNRATEVSYQSKKLLSPDESTQVHFEGTLRKVVNDPENAPRSDNGFCHANKAQTVIDQLVVDVEGETTIFDSFSYDGGYIILEPLSFSPDGQYLVTRADTVYAGMHNTPGIALFSPTNGQITTVSNMCDGLMESDMDAVDYIGFSSSGEMIVECQPTGRQGRSNRFESINLQSGVVNQLTERPSRTTSHGTTLGYFEITKVQRFD